MTGPHVYTAIKGVMSDIGERGISKDRKNQQQGYSFRGIDDVYNALNGLLAKHDLVIIPTVISRAQTERQSAKGGILIYTTLDVEFEFISAMDGSTHKARTVGEAMDSGDKSSNKAMAAAFKYAAMMVFCIPTEGDNDADATTHEVVPQSIVSLPPIHNDTKTNTRDEFQSLCKEIDDIASLAALNAWKMKPENIRRMESLNFDLAENFRNSFKEKVKFLKESAAA